MPEMKTVIRSELYAQVWQQSMVQLAKAYAISESAMPKAPYPNSGTRLLGAEANRSNDCTRAGPA